MNAKSKNLGQIVLVLATVLLSIGCQKEYSATAPKYQAPAGATEFTASIPGDIDISSRKLEQGGKCSLDTVNKIAAGTATKIELNTDLFMSGWAVDEQNASLGKTLMIELKNIDGKTNYYAATTTRGQRPDVAVALKNKKYENSGFELVAVGKAVKAGKYGINILIIDEKTSTSCDTDKKFIFE